MHRPEPFNGAIGRPRGRDQKRSGACLQLTSFWLEAKRETFTAEAIQHFERQRLPQTTMLGVTLLTAKKHGVVY